MFNPANQLSDNTNVSDKQQTTETGKSLVEFDKLSLNDMRSLNNSQKSSDISEMFGTVDIAVAPLDGKPPLNPNPNDQHPTKDS